MTDSNESSEPALTNASIFESGSITLDLMTLEWRLQQLNEYKIILTRNDGSKYSTQVRPGQTKEMPTESSFLVVSYEKNAVPPSNIRRLYACHGTREYSLNCE